MTFSEEVKLTGAAIEDVAAKIFLKRYLRYFGTYIKEDRVKNAKADVSKSTTTFFQKDRYLNLGV